MTDETDTGDCVSKKPWGEVLSRSLKLFTFNLAREGGRSFGRALFFIIVGLIAFGLCAYLINSLTGWFSGLFDFWPFSRTPEAEPESTGWLKIRSAEPPAISAGDGNEKWYCKWNPIC